MRDMKDLLDSLMKIFNTKEQVEAPVKPRPAPVEVPRRAPVRKPSTPIKPMPGQKPKPKGSKRSVVLFKQARKNRIKND